MNTNTVNPEARFHAGPPFGTGSRRTALRRPVQGSVVAGVAAGLARYLGVDVVIIRLAFGRGSLNWSQARQARAPDAAVRSQASTETAMGR